MEATDVYFQQLKAGKQRALDYFIQQHMRPLTFFAAKLVQSETVGEEIVCDSFLKLWDTREQLESGRHIQSFLYLVTKNACLNHRSSPKNQWRTTDVFPDTLAQPDEDTLTKIVHAELIQQLYEEVAKLPGQQATIFRMSYLEGYTTEEICDALGTTPSNVFYAKSKALSTLRRVFQEKNIGLYWLLTQALWQLVSYGI